MSERLYIIDTASPFFSEYDAEGSTVNWSKVPFASLEKRGMIRRKRRRRIKSNFLRYITTVSAMGYTAIAVDDLCHLVPFDFYPQRLRHKIERYRHYLRGLFAAAKKRGLKVFITTDSFFSNTAIRRHTRKKFSASVSFMRDAVESVFKNEPHIDGIIIRSGESDGVDVSGDFLSAIIIKTPRDARRYLTALLPVFERHGKTCIFRTWSVGAFRIGDMMWNERTYRSIFGKITSANLVISMKYGDSDFYRHLELNKFFFEDDGHRKIIELQTRREYEGFGEYPSFVGWQYEVFARALADETNFAGIYVWCQTGGWSKARNVTFSGDTSLWNELNTFSTIKLFRWRWSVRKTVAAFFPGRDIERIMRFLSICDEAITHILYDSAFALRTLYFNRTRLPPLLHVFWHHVTVTRPVAALYRHYIKNTDIALSKAKAALRHMKELPKLARKLKLPYRAAFHRRSFSLLYHVKKALYCPMTEQELAKLMRRIERYHRRYPDAYRFYVDPKINTPSPMLNSAVRFIVRARRRYRVVDRMMFNPVSAAAMTAAMGAMKRHLPRFTDRQAMPLSSLLR